MTGLIEVEPSLIYLLVGFAFISGLAFGWGLSEIIKARQIINTEMRRVMTLRRDFDPPILKAGDGASSWKALGPAAVINKTKAMTARPKWNHGDEDWLLGLDIDATRVASDQDRQS